MAKTFNDLSDAELGSLLRSRYDRLCEAHDMGLDDGPHPSERWAADTEILKAHREARANDEGGLGNVEIVKRGTPESEQGLDDDQPKITGGLPSKKVAQDEMILRSGHHDVPGQLALAAAKRVNPTRAANMAARIAGYDRLNRR